MYNRLIRCIVWIAALLFTVPVAVAAQQRADTTETVADTTRFGAAAADTTGAWAFKRLPIRTPFLSPTRLLQQVSGSFVYDLGERGWPHGWSRDGEAPRNVQLTFDGLPFSDPVTGQPLYQLLPFDLLEPFNLGMSRYGKPLAVQTHLRGFQAPEPLTELRYHAGSGGLQAISVAHAQQRRLALFGRPGTANALFGFAGRSTNGIYPNSATRLRRVVGRLRYQQPSWSLTLRHLFNNSEMSLHGGVLPRGRLRSLYEPLGSQVALSDARRRVIRHDALADLTWSWHSELDPVQLRGFWNRHETRFRTFSDTLATRVGRWGMQARQSLTAGAHRFTIRGDLWRDRLQPGNALLGRQGATRWETHLVLQDSLQQQALGAVLKGGWHQIGKNTYPSAGAEVYLPLGALRLQVGGAFSGYVPSWLEQYGFNGQVAAPAKAAKSRHLQGQTRLQWNPGSLELALRGSFQLWQRPILLLRQPELDQAQLLQLSGAQQWLTLGGEASWRKETRRGFRISIEPSLFRLLTPTTLEHYRLQASLPSIQIKAKAGLRYPLFQNDLDLLVYLQGRAWTALRSRGFQPSTTLFPLMPLEARSWGPNGTLDLQVEGQIRKSTVFFAYKNLLSGLLYPGALVTPTYPLPAQYVQFGVFWPLFN